MTDESQIHDEKLVRIWSAVRDLETSVNELKQHVAVMLETNRRMVAFLEGTSTTEAAPIELAQLRTQVESLVVRVAALEKDNSSMHWWLLALMASVIVGILSNIPYVLALVKEKL